MIETAMVTCPCCGVVVPADRLKPMVHAPGLPACDRCRAKVEATGSHKAPYDPRRHDAAVAAKLKGQAA